MHVTPEEIPTVARLVSKLCGVVLDEETRELRIYYGAADFVVALATADFDEVLSYLLTGKV